MNVSERIIRAFPSAVKVEAEAVATAMALERATLSPDSFKVVVGAELVAIPQRLYVGEQRVPASRSGVTACLLTRHHDGFVRQRGLERVLRLDEPWAMPFVVQLVGEYVIEIIEQIDEAFAETPVENLGAFVVANPDFIRLTRARHQLLELLLPGHATSGARRLPFDGQD